jgi:aryl-alcohol dehydrogenase
VINAREQDAGEALMEFSGGRGIDRTLEATGVPAVLEQAIEVLAPRGVCGIVGAPAPDAEVSMNILTAIVKGSSVVGINQGDPVPREAIPALVGVAPPGSVPVPRADPRLPVRGHPAGGRRCRCGNRRQASLFCGCPLRRARGETP